MLSEEHIALQVITLVNDVTFSLISAQDRRQEDYKVLRQALAYCWSVAIVGLPIAGKMYMENWLKSGDKDVQWVMRENLKKKRLEKMDPDWVREVRQKLDH